MKRRNMLEPEPRKERETEPTAAAGFQDAWARKRGDKRRKGEGREARERLARMRDEALAELRQSCLLSSASSPVNRQCPATCTSPTAPQFPPSFARSKQTTIPRFLSAWFPDALLRFSARRCRCCNGHPRENGLSPVRLLKTSLSPLSLLSGLRFCHLSPSPQRLCLPCSGPPASLHRLHLVLLRPFGLRPFPLVDLEERTGTRRTKNGRLPGDDAVRSCGGSFGLALCGMKKEENQNQREKRETCREESKNWWNRERRRERENQLGEQKAKRQNPKMPRRVLETTTEGSRGSKTAASEPQEKSRFHL